MASEVTEREVDRLVAAISIADTLQEFGSAPEGHLYAALMDKLQLSDFLQVMSGLARIGVISRAGHVATFVRPIREAVPELALIPNRAAETKKELTA